MSNTADEDEIMKKKFMDLTQDLMMLIDNHKAEMPLDHVFYISIRHLVLGMYMAFDDNNTAYALVSNAISDAISDHAKSKKLRELDDSRKN